MEISSRVQEWEKKHQGNLILVSDFIELAKLKSEAFWEKSKYYDIMVKMLTDEVPSWDKGGTLDVESCPLEICPVCGEQVKFPDEKTCYLCYRTYYDKMSTRY